MKYQYSNPSQRSGVKGAISHLLNKLITLSRYQVFIIMLSAALLLGVTYFLISNNAAVPNDQNQAITDNPVAQKTLYVHSDNNAARQVKEWQISRPDDAKTMDQLAKLPSSEWIGHETDLLTLPDYIASAKSKGHLAVTVAYFIPKRDCSSYSSGGAANAEAYRAFIQSYAKAIGDAEVVVILEPDAIAQPADAQMHQKTCLSPQELQERLQLLDYAVATFKALPATKVYIDAGNSGWIPVEDTVVTMLKSAGIDRADGFSLNVSNFQYTDATIKYGRDMSGKLKGKHFVVDTSRNGLGPYDNKKQPDFNWCNPPGRALGHYPTLKTGEPKVDAYLYIKNIGESDGYDKDNDKCFGGPKAGDFDPDYALGLLQRWPKNLQPKS
jgi:endoglucanase